MPRCNWHTTSGYRAATSRNGHLVKEMVAVWVSSRRSPGKAAEPGDPGSATSTPLPVSLTSRAGSNPSSDSSIIRARRHSECRPGGVGPILRVGRPLPRSWPRLCPTDVTVAGSVAECAATSARR